MNVFTHNGCVTVVSKKTGDHRTFRVKTQADDASFAPNARIISILSGPDNENDYQGIGFVNENGIRLWNSKRTEFFEKCMNILSNPDKFKDAVDIMFEAKCRVCNRKLTNPVSIESGIGPECAKR